jgi:fructose-specific phosphotransferase system IIA component
MRITELLAGNCILLDVDAQVKEDVWRIMADHLYKNGVIDNVGQFLNDVQKRELQGTTGVGFGVAIPHAKSGAVKKTALAMARLVEGIDVASLDGTKADLFFLIAVPLQGENVHLQTLSKLARMLVYESFLASLRAAKTTADILTTISEQEG